MAQVPAASGSSRTIEPASTRRDALWLRSCTLRRVRQLELQAPRRAVMNCSCAITAGPRTRPSSKPASEHEPAPSVVTIHARRAAGGPACIAHDAGYPAMLSGMRDKTPGPQPTTPITAATATPERLRCRSPVALGPWMALLGEDRGGSRLKRPALLPHTDTQVRVPSPALHCDGRIAGSLALVSAGNHCTHCTRDETLH